MDITLVVIFYSIFVFFCSMRMWSVAHVWARVTHAWQGCSSVQCWSTRALKPPNQSAWFPWYLDANSSYWWETTVNWGLSSCVRRRPGLGFPSLCLRGWWCSESDPSGYRCSTVCTLPSVLSHPIYFMKAPCKMELLQVRKYPGSIWYHLV